jgi:hypothetical protein
LCVCLPLDIHSLLLNKKAFSLVENSLNHFENAIFFCII